MEMERRRRPLDADYLIDHIRPAFALNKPYQLLSPKP